MAIRAETVLAAARRVFVMTSTLERKKWRGELPSRGSPRMK
jgi:hypothetical protein